jgi:hypothetical protein
MKSPLGALIVLAALSGAARGQEPDTSYLSRTVDLKDVGGRRPLENESARETSFFARVPGAHRRSPHEHLYWPSVARDEVGSDFTSPPSSTSLTSWTSPWIA